MTSAANIFRPQEALWLPATYVNVVSGAPGVQGILMQQNGAIEANQNGVIVSLGLWNGNRTSLVTNRFEFMLQVVSGVWTGNLTGTWLNFGSIGPTINWFCSGAPNSATGNLHIRRIGSTVTLRSCFISLTNN